MRSSRAWARCWGAPAVAVALGLLELALVRLAGPPGRQLEVLRQLGQVGADPLASMLALLALAAEGLAAYLLAVLVLRLLALLPGVAGRLASGASLLVTPASVRRALDLLLGGALLAQVTLTSLPGPPGAVTAVAAAVRSQASPTPLPGPAGAATAPVAAALVQTTLSPPPTRAAANPPPVAGRLAWARPGQDRPVAPAPLPPWLAGWPPRAGDGGPAGPDAAGGRGSAAVGGGPPRPGAASGRGPAGPEETASGGGSARAGGGSAGRGSVPDRPRRPERPPAPVDTGGGHRGGVVGTHMVRPGDTLWGIAAAHLPPARRSPATIDRYWRQLYHANRAVVGPDPGLIHPGTRLRVPGYRPDRR
jgi:nucleoid-associated protein YgaU